MIRYELHRFIALNYQEQWVAPHLALQQLERYGNELIPQLVECLSDSDSDVRYLAVQLLGEARPRSNIAVPALIDRLSDENQVVRGAVAYELTFFGPLAAAAVPLLDSWLVDDDEYIRVLAATAIMRLEPNRSELSSVVQMALTSAHPMVSALAEDFFNGER